MATSSTDGTTLEPDRDPAFTRSLLRFGVIAGPFYLALGFGQAQLREGFDITRHPLSLLANGPGGWVQAANFVLTGVMVIAAAIGITRTLGPGSRAASVFLAGFGLSMIAAAIFPADPVNGFPPGTPEGLPTTISTAGILHFFAGMLGFVCLAVSALVAALALSRRHLTLLARLSLVTGLAVLLGFFGGMFLLPSTLGIWFAVIVGWAWLAATSFQLLRRIPNGTSERVGIH